jgi:cytochrome b involved in lipid metabolism
MYVDVHPGGKKILEKVYGKDMTAMFNKFHGYVNINAMIGPLKIGTVKKQQFSPNEAPKVENPIKEEDEDKSDN